MSTDAEVVKVSKHLAIAEHAEDTEDVTEQSVRGKLNLQFYQQKAVLEKLNMQFYQQPSGFVDGVICAWSSEPQAQQAPCSIREVRETAALNNQLITEIEKRSMTSARQLTDTDKAFRLKSCQRIKEKGLSKELMRVAQLEGHQTR